METQRNVQRVIEEADEIFADYSRRMESRPIYEKALNMAKGGGKLLEIEYVQGKIDLVDEKYEDAVKHFDEVIMMDSDHFKAWNYKGIALGNLGRYEEALTCFDKAIKIKPDYEIAWNGKGIALGNLGRYEEALTCYDKAIKIKPDYEIAWYNKGVALDDLGRYEEALTCYDKAIKIKPDYEIAWYNKGVALDDLGRYEEALTCYDKAIKIKPDYEIAWNNKGNALYSLGRYEEALTCFDKAIKIKPDDEYAWNNKGNALYSLGRYEEALTCYDKAIKIKPDYEYAWNGKGNALYSLGRYEEALTCFDKAIKIKPDYELPRANKNLTLIRLGKFNEAEKEREKIYSDKKEEISKSKLPPEEKKSEILEIDAWKEVLDELKDKITDILDAKKDYEKNLAASLNPRNNPLSDNFFSVLRRWNSYTPTLHTATEENLGGGYFLFWKGKGIVIDPGFNFVDNFLNNGFLIYDIDAVIITHAHVDHCSDFESLLTLLFEYNENKANKKRIDIFMNIGAMKKILGWINLEESGLVERVYSLEEGNSRDLKKYNLRLTVTRALHDEVLSKAYSTGLIFELYGEDGYTRENPFRIGYTSD
ncbi:MAG: tetratricopeptide repeat protein, partial [Theionarchaea archaeon]|nr:tetratricopeptide repeat protein [Theionarchaea archaeon]